MKITEPKIDQRKEQPYAGIRARVSISELPNTIPTLVDEVYGWLGKQGIESVGGSFIRFNVINMADNLDIQIGVPVVSPITGDGRVQAGMIPAGRYASLIYTGVANGMPANKVLIDWAAEQGLKWDRWDDPDGDAF